MPALLTGTAPRCLQTWGDVHPPKKAAFIKYIEKKRSAFGLGVYISPALHHNVVDQVVGRREVMVLDPAPVGARAGRGTPRGTQGRAERTEGEDGPTTNGAPRTKYTFHARFPSARAGYLERKSGPTLIDGTCAVT